MSGEMIGLEGVLRNLSQWEADTRTQAELAGHAIAQLLEEYARTHHAWQSRLGETEASIGAEVEMLDTLVSITLIAGTDSARFLELARGGKWSWLWEAVEANLEPIRQILEEHLRGVG